MEFALRIDDSIQIDERNSSLRALAYELKHPLIRIARQAELGKNTNLETIQQTAEQALQLIDGYILSAQAEYGQIALDLSPVNAGSVLYDVSVQLRSQAHAYNTDLTLDSRAQESVMTHRQALTSIINALGVSLLASVNQSVRSSLTLRSYKTSGGKICVGVFTYESITQADLRTALALQGKAHMPLSRFSSSAHVSLAIADGLCRAIDGVLTVRRMGKMSGLVAELPRSEQLLLV